MNDDQIFPFKNLNLMYVTINAFYSRLTIVKYPTVNHVIARKIQLFCVTIEELLLKSILMI